jgi:hypothetical protein
MQARDERETPHRSSPTAKEKQSKTLQTKTATMSAFQGSLLLVVGLIFASPPPTCYVNAFGGEKRAFPTSYLNDDGVIRRQDVCDRYQLFRSGSVELRDALRGLELRPYMHMNEFFNYSDEDGIDPAVPGLQAELMDRLAERAGFTWRSSFGIMEPPESINATWTEMLLWGVDRYDLAVSWWDKSTERMDRGVAFLEPWFDGSIVLINKEDPPVQPKGFNLWNWLRPFTPSVWVLTIVTVIISGIMYQIIEHFTDEREGRSFARWFSDNLVSSKERG